MECVLEAVLHLDVHRYSNTSGLNVLCGLQACYSQAANERSAGRAPAETKRCRRCGNTKEAADFYVSKMTADGLQSYCKACYAVASAARRNRVSHEQVCCVLS